MNPMQALRRGSTSRLDGPPRSSVLLIRHAETAWSGARLCGREPGIHLNARGRADARTLSARLAGMPVAAIYASPLDRAIDTASPIADARGGGYFARSMRSPIGIRGTS